MPELNWYCKECESLNYGCDGCTEKVYSGCIYRKHWLDRGNKVRVVGCGFMGIVQWWDWVTNTYFVKFDDGKVLPYRKDQLEEVMV